MRPILNAINVPVGARDSAMSRSVAVIESLDLDFAGSRTGHLTHGLHPYPAKFIPQIPNLLIRELSLPGDTVADIFCGSGTTAIEAMVLGRHAVGIDANPLACLITKAKTTRFRPGEKEILDSLAAEADKLGQDIAEQQGHLFGGESMLNRKAPMPPDESLAFWFEPFVMEELSHLVARCRSLPIESVRTVALVALSSIIVNVSKQDSDTRYVRRAKRIMHGETVQRFARALSGMTGAIQEFTDRVAPNLTCTIHEANLLQEPEVRPFDLMVCSPPYPNAYSYHLYHRTRMLWLGMDQPRFKREEIGSHRKYSSKGSNGATVHTFKAEMELILRWMGRYLKRDGLACFVIGDSTLKGLKVNNADLISEAGSENGFQEVSRATRQIQTSKKSFNPAIGKIKDERILILQNVNEN